MSPGEWVELKEKQLLLEIPPKALGEIPCFLSPPILQSSASTSFDENYPEFGCQGNLKNGVSCD